MPLINLLALQFVTPPPTYYPLFSAGQLLTTGFPAAQGDLAQARAVAAPVNTAVAQALHAAHAAVYDLYVKDFAKLKAQILANDFVNDFAPLPWGPVPWLNPQFHDATYDQAVLPITGTKTGTLTAAQKLTIKAEINSCNSHLLGIKAAVERCNAATFAQGGADDAVFKAFVAKLDARIAANVALIPV